VNLFGRKNKFSVCKHCTYQKKDLLAVLPTGFGKSLIYQASPF